MRWITLFYNLRVGNHYAMGVAEMLKFKTSHIFIHLTFVWNLNCMNYGHTHFFSIVFRNIWFNQGCLALSRRMYFVSAVISPPCTVYYVLCPLYTGSWHWHTRRPSHCHTVAESGHQEPGPPCLQHPHRGRHGRGHRPPAVRHLAVAETEQNTNIQTENILAQKIRQSESEKKSRLRRRFI